MVVAESQTPSAGPQIERSSGRGLKDAPATSADVGATSLRGILRVTRELLALTLWLVI